VNPSLLTYLLAQLDPSRLTGQDGAGTSGSSPDPNDTSILSSNYDPPDDLDEAVDTIYDTLWKLWEDFLSHVPFLVAGLIVLLATALGAWIGSHLVERALTPVKTRESLKQLIVRFVVVVVWIAGIMITAVVILPGLTPARALGGLGLISIAIGFAFKDIFENFFAGILLLWRFPFERGDFLECEGIMGRVVSIDVRMTQIRRTTGELVVLPNSFLFKHPVDILTHHPARRIDITVGVAYSVYVPKAVEVITAAVEKCETVEKRLPVQVFPEGFGSSSIDIQVAWWTGSKPVDLRTSRAEVVTAIKLALDEAGLEIPFPYRTLTFKEPLGVEQLRASEPREN